MKFAFFKLHKGFTLVELLLVIALIGLISTVGVVSFVNYNRAVTLQQAAADFASTLNTAKSKAYAQVNACGVGNSFDGYNVVTAAASYSLKIVCSGAPTIISSTSLTNITIAPANKTIFFPVLTGGANGVSAAGTAFTFTMGSITKTVTVNSAGIITGP